MKEYIKRVEVKKVGRTFELYFEHSPDIERSELHPYINENYEELTGNQFPEGKLFDNSYLTTHEFEEGEDYVPTILKIYVPITKKVVIAYDDLIVTTVRQDTYNGYSFGLIRVELQYRNKTETVSWEVYERLKTALYMLVKEEREQNVQC